LLKLLFVEAFGDFSEFIWRIIVIIGFILLGYDRQYSKVCFLLVPVAMAISFLKTNIFPMVALY
jgi:hypothetical protein